MISGTVPLTSALGGHRVPVQPAPARRRARRRLGDYVVVHDPEGTLLPWQSMFPEVEVLAGLRMRIWTPGTVFFHLRRRVAYRVSPAYALERVPLPSPEGTREATP